MLLSSCYSWPAGDDPQGLRFRNQANEVFVAVSKFKIRYGFMPKRAEQLVPEFLSATPTSIKLFFSSGDEQVSYIYSPSWPQSGQVNCSRTLESKSWSCMRYM